MRRNRAIYMKTGNQATPTGVYPAFNRFASDKNLLKPRPESYSATGKRKPSSKGGKRNQGELYSQTMAPVSISSKAPYALPASP